MANSGVSNNQLCDFCNQLLHKARDTNEISRTLLSLSGEWNSLNFFTSVFSRAGELDGILFYTKWPAAEDPRADEYCGSIEFHKVDEAPYVDPNRLPSDSDCDQVWSLVNGWMRLCQTKHPDCNIVPPETWRPTRLLDVRSLDNSIILREGDDIPYRPKYATLSHCWGGNNHLTLTKETAVQLKSDFPVDGLDQSFRDAVRIAKRLECDYLWIDSLCIQQDSTEDWQKESRLMGDIYQNGFVNIAAAGAQNAKGGCFAPRKADPHAPTRIRLGDDEYVCTHKRRFWKDFKEKGLSQRGWVLQERFLAPRVIHWGLSEMVWECNCDTLCERFPLGFPGPADYWPSSTFKRISTSTAETFAKHDIRQAKAAWGDICMKYCAAKLTKESDKLVALTGIVKKFRSIFQDDFYAGLWQRDMELELLWCTGTGVSKTHGRLGQDIAPTWSWLSLRETRLLPGLYIKGDLKLCQITDFQFEKSGNHEFTVSNASLTVRCSLFLVMFRYCPDLNTPHLNKLFWYTEDGQKVEGKDVSVHFDTAQQTASGGVWCMPVGQSKDRMSGLLLDNVEGGPLGVYHRVGYFNMGREDVEEIWKLCNSSYEEQPGANLYVGILRYDTKSEKSKESSTVQSAELPSSGGILAKEEDMRLRYRECYVGVPQHEITIK